MPLAVAPRRGRLPKIRVNFQVHAGSCEATLPYCVADQAGPRALVAGREDIMRRFGDGVVHGGTFTGHSVALAAAEKTLEILDETPALETIANYGIRLRTGMSRILSQRGIPPAFTGHPAMSGLFLKDVAPQNYRDWASSDYAFYDTMAPVLHDLGILCEPDSREPWFICEAHDEACLNTTLQQFALAVDVVLENRGSGRLGGDASGDI